MKYRILMHVVIDSPSDAAAAAQAVKLQTLLKHPMVRMAISDEGIKLDGDGKPVVYAPQREVA